MEKNGFIFIKQNFEMFEGAEPTLTEISDNECKVKLEGTTSAGVQTEEQTKSVVKIIDSGKSVRVGKLKPDGSREIDLQSMHMPKLKKQVNLLGSNEGKTGKSVNILGKKRQILNQANDRSVLVGVNGQLVSSKSAPMIAKPIPASVSAPHIPLQLVKTVPAPAPILKQDAVQLVQLVTGGMIPIAPNNGPIQIVPVTLQTALPLQGVLQPAPVLSQSNIKNSPVTISASKMISHEAESKPMDGSFILPTSYNSQMLESQAGTTFITKVSPVDEKGDNGGVGIGQQILSATPVVSDAPWQGVLNINSEQELLEYINSQSTSGEGDKNLTIFIQNVDGPGGGITGTLDSQMLSGISNLGDGFVDQGLIMSDVLPTVSNVEEVHLNAENSVSVTLSDNMSLLGAETAADIPHPISKNEQEINMGETSVVFSVNNEIPATSLSIDDSVTGKEESDGAAMIISEGMIPVEHNPEAVHGNENVQVTHVVETDQNFSNCESEPFSENVTLLEPTIVDVHVREVVHGIGSGVMVHEADVAGECDRTQKSLYTDHDFYSVPVAMTEVDHGVDHDQTEAQCYNDSVMLNTQEATLEGPRADDP